MDFKNVKKSLIQLAVTSVIGFVVTGCGGGAAPDSTVIPDKERKALNTESASSIMESLNGLNKTLGDINAEGIVGGNIRVSSMKLAKSMSKLTKMQPTAASNAINCSGGGTISISSSSSAGSITYNKCIESTMYVDGTLSVKGSETAGTITISNFVLKTESNGDMAEASVSSANITYAFGESYKLNSMELSANGYAKTTVSGVEDRVDFKIAKIKVTQSTALFKGSVKTTCLGGWIVVSTPETISFNDEGLSGGKVVISGNDSEITVNISTDGKATLINTDGTETTYANIDALMEELSTGTCAASL